MYERNAIVLERFFEDLFGITEKCNLKDNFIKYDNLVECSAKYAEATESEDKIMQEYDDIASRIKNIQRNQEILSEKSVKFHEERRIVFQNIAEDAQTIRKMFDDLDRKIDENNEKIKQNEKDFVDVISNFMDKSNVRNSLGKERKQVEANYSNALNETLDMHKNINKEKLQNSRDFGEKISEFEKELTEKVRKNGENEIVPFYTVAIKSAIKLDINIQKKVIEILCNAYDKTSRLFLEIKNNNTKLERHRKLIKDSKAKLEFLDALKEYLIQFLDNERLTAVNGETEHKKQMKEACKNFEEDLIQINNLYELLLKEISGKANKKMYKELYNVKYLDELEKSVVQFEREISRLNLIGTIINPNHWRIDAIKKIYEVFFRNVTENYGRDLSDFIIKEELSEEVLDNIKDKDDDYNGNDIKIEKNNVEKSIDQINDYVKEIGKMKEKNHIKEEKEDEFDEKIDMILGFDKKDSIINKKDTAIEEEKNIDSRFDEYDSKISDDDFWAEEDDDVSLYGFSSEENDKEDIDYWDDDLEEEDYDDWDEDIDANVDYEENEDEYIDNTQVVDQEDKDNYTIIDDEEKNEYKDHSPWDENEDIFMENDKDSNKSIIRKTIDFKNKKPRGKHNKKEEKPRGIFGKLLR